MAGRAQSQEYRGLSGPLDVVTGTEAPQWEASCVRYGTVRETRTLDGSGGRVMPTTLRLGAAIRLIRQAWLADRGRLTG